MLEEMSTNFLQLDLLDMVQTISIIVMLFLALKSSFKDRVNQEIDHLYKHLAIRQREGEVLSTKNNFYSELKRKPTKRKPITDEEFHFVRLKIFQLYIAFKEIKGGLHSDTEGLKRDIKHHFRFPIFLDVWNKIKDFQEEEFSIFINTLLDSGNY